MRLPSIAGVNRLYLVTVLLIVSLSVAVPSLPLGWRLWTNELLILIPLVLYLVLARLPVRRTLRLRLRWPHRLMAFLSLLVGLSLAPVGMLLSAVLSKWLSYTPPLAPASLILTVVDLLLFVLGTTLLAAIVEELLFRGVIQTAYERRSPLQAILLGAVLFALFHLDPIQSVAVLPLGLALGYVAWRSNSVIPAILLHFGHNAVAAAVTTVAFFWPGAVPVISTAPAALAGAVLAVIGLGLVTHLTRRVLMVAPPERSTWLARAWPVGVVVLIFLLVAGIALAAGAQPERFSAGRPLELAAAPWTEKIHWQYEIRNALDQPVGQAACSLTPETDTFLLTCDMEQAAYEVDTPTGYFSQDAASQRQVVRWDRQTLHLQTAAISSTIAPGIPITATLAPAGQGLLLTVTVEGRAGGELHLPPDVLMAGGGTASPLMVGEWPWRLSALPFAPAYSREATLAWPYRSQQAGPEPDRSPEARPVYVVVPTATEISTPLGDFVTWRVRVGDRYTAWYDVNPPHMLVAYNDDRVTWLITSVE